MGQTSCHHGWAATPAKSTLTKTMKGEGAVGSPQPTVLPGKPVPLGDDGGKNLKRKLRSGVGASGCSAFWTDPLAQDRR